MMFSYCVKFQDKVSHEACNAHGWVSANDSNEATDKVIEFYNNPWTVNIFKCEDVVEHRNEEWDI